MSKPSFILRLLLLIALLGGLGITQPAAAQQTVTLSGRVTDAVGQPVRGAFVELFRLPGWVWVNGQETDGNGTYRLTAAPGTYYFEILPPHGSLIRQRIDLTLSTHTTRDIVLEQGVTLSGRVTTANGRPPTGVWLSIHSDAGEQFSSRNVDTSGHYSLGLPVGTYRIEVHHDAFLNPRLEGVEVTQDTILNITLESRVLLEGKVVDDAGQPVPDAQVCAHLPAEEPWEGICAETELEGGFQLRVAPTVYVVTATPLAPLQPTRHRLEVSGVGATDLILTVSRQPMPFVPDDPPKAALISISPPTTDGEVTLSGAASSVAPGSAVFAVTLNTGHFTTAQATANGSFTATLFAPAGTSVLIRADPVGTNVARFLYLFFETDQTPDEALSALPGTILRVANPPGAGIPIGGAGKVEGDRPAWTFRGSINTHTLAPGDSLRVRGTVRVDSPALQGTDMLQVNTSLGLEPAEGLSLLHVDAGSASTFLTPTGLPIERQGQWWAAGFDQYQDLPLVKTASAQAEAEVDLTLTLPPDMPAGYYRPFLVFYFPDIPTEESFQPAVKIPGDRGALVLPTITVGNPASPRLDWMLLLDTLSNGSRGVVAVEDANRFGIAQRILTSSETFVISRLDAASGQSLTYRLEPFVPTVSLVTTSFGGIPVPPRVPFRFPSGSLTVTIRHPDGIETVLGPAPFVQSRSKSLVSEEGVLLDVGGGHILDAYQLTTLDPRFEVTFAQDGLHVVTVEGTIDDIWGNTWTGGGTYDVHVGRVLALDTAVLPGTHFEVGDGFNPGLVVSPPLTAEVEVRVQYIPHSDLSQLQEQVIRGRTNRFGYFQPAVTPSCLTNQASTGSISRPQVGTHRDTCGWARGPGAASWPPSIPPSSPTDGGGLMPRTRLGHSGFFSTTFSGMTSLLISRSHFSPAT